MTPPILIAQHNTLGVITLNHPEKHNCLSLAMMDALIAAYQDFDNNPNIHVIILQANGKNFCAGADLAHMKAMSVASSQDNLQDAHKLAHFFYKLYACQTPTICCVQGKTRGGGVGLMALHDFVIVASDATFSFPEIKIGLMPATIAPFVSQRIGYQSAKKYMLSTDVISAQQAQKINLVDSIAENNVTDDAMQFAELLSKHDLNAMQKTKAWLQELHPITQVQVNRAAELLAEVRGELK